MTKAAHNRVDMVGKTYNQWKILAYQKTVGKITFYQAQCLECEGIHDNRDGRNIRLGLSKRCTGCGRKASIKARTGKMRAGMDPLLFAQKRLFRGYKKGAKERNLEFTLTLEDFKFFIDKNCIYCKFPPRKTVNPLKGHDFSEEKLSKGWITYNGIDRSDNTKGYTFENCVPCCHICNFAKRNLTTREFLQWVIQLYTNLIQT